MRDSHLRHKMRHRAKWVVCLYYLFASAYVVLDLITGFPDNVDTIVTLVGLGFLLLALNDMISHARGPLCELCITDMPLNGPEMAEQWSRQRRLYHWVNESNKRFLLVGAVFMTISLVFIVALSVPGSALLVNLPLSYWLYANIRHDQVQPWCKLCGWDEGGGYEEWVPDPDPSASRDR